MFLDLAGVETTLGNDSCERCEIQDWCRYVLIETTIPACGVYLHVFHVPCALCTHTTASHTGLKVDILPEMFLLATGLHWLLG